MSTESFNLVHTVSVNGGSCRLFGYKSKKTTTTTSVIKGLGVSDLTDIIASTCGIQGNAGKSDGSADDGNDARRSCFDRIVDGLSRWIDGSDPVFEEVVVKPVEDSLIDIDVRVRVERVVQ